MAVFRTIAARPAADTGNRITYACSEERLSTALKAIERLSGFYKLQFSSEDVEPYRVSIHINGVTMDVALRDLLRNTPLRYSVKDRFIRLSKPAQPAAGLASGDVYGTVFDAEKQPAIGATVRVKGVSGGVVTDVDGKYKIKVAPGQTLVFSYVA